MITAKEVEKIYLESIFNSKEYFDKKSGKIRKLSPLMKLSYMFLVKSGHYHHKETPYSDSADYVKKQIVLNLNIEEESLNEFFDFLFNARLLLFKVGGMKHEADFDSMIYESDSILLSEEFHLDDFISSLPENYISHYLYIKHHSDIVDNKLTMTIEAISNATGVNGSEVGFMNKLFKEMGYFSITKEPKTGTNIYEVIK